MVASDAGNDSGNPVLQQLGNGVRASQSKGITGKGGTLKHARKTVVHSGNSEVGKR